MLPLRFKTQLGAKSSRALSKPPKGYHRFHHYSSASAKPIVRRAIVAGGATVILVGSFLAHGYSGAYLRNNPVYSTPITPDEIAGRGRDRMKADGPRNTTHEQDPSSSKGQQEEEVVTPKELYAKDEPLCFVIGTGIDASHNEFNQGQILELSDPADDSTPTLQQSTFHIPKDCPEQGQSCWAHETKVASVIGGKHCGIAPGTKLVDVRIAYYDPATEECTYDNEKLERRFMHIKSFLEANPETPAVINLSMGAGWSKNVGSRRCKCREEWQYPTAIIRNRKVDRTIRKLYELGTLTVAAAGNECSPAYANWPASNPYVLSVGALDRYGAESEFNNFGAAVAVLARGVDVRVAYRPPDGYETASGTSFASPYVAGIACDLLANAESKPGLQTKELRPGALKSILFSQFHVEQKGLTQPERYRRRSDGEAIGEEEEDGEDDRINKDGGDNGDRDNENSDSDNGKPTPEVPDTKKDGDDSSKAEGCKDSEAEEDGARINDGKDDDSKDNSKDNS